MTETTFRPAEMAFHDAIASGRLSTNPASEIYALHYMYMGTRGGVDLFKHYNTRQYLPEPRESTRTR